MIRRGDDGIVVSEGSPRRTTRRRTTEYLKALDDRVERLEAKLDERFAAPAARFEQVTSRFEQIDRRLDEQRTHAGQLERQRADFQRLYDLLKAHFERTNAWLDRIESANVVRFADLQSAIAALAPRVRNTRGRR